MQDKPFVQRKYADVPERLNQLSRAVIGAAIEVHRQLGPGLLERTYEDALAIEFELRNIKFERQVPLAIRYKDQLVTSCALDLLVEGELVVELKAVDALLQIHRAQVVAYLQAGAFELGLLMNFNVPVLKDGIRRVILTSPLEPVVIEPATLK